ncbi:MAG: tyrosine recombinase XerC [Clostridia bacterium]|nr:tyrosine recombinase XerC [Clostridia bacterium]
MLPAYGEDFLIYMDSISGKSKRTIHEYYYDLLMFFRFLKVRRRLAKRDAVFEEIDVADLDLDVLKSVNLSDLYAFLNYINSERGDIASTRSRKVSCIKSFFKYCFSRVNIIPVNPAAELESPKQSKRLPKYLELDESRDLLGAVDENEEFEERDYCIITLFLNCGMRLSELVGINTTDIRDDVLRVIGKGNKERAVYLNDACMKAIDNYMKVREDVTEKGGVHPLFVSKRKKRISPKTVEYTVKKYIIKAGLDPQKYSVHKLRHTAATLMYTYGGVDIRALQEILGHESVATTQIYTHVNSQLLKDAVRSNPLSSERKEASDKRKPHDHSDADGKENQ